MAIGYWRTCIESYLQGQDLWEVVAGTMTDPPMKESSLRKWRIKVGKAMFVLKTTIEEDLVEHIRDAETPKEAWETLAKLFCKKNEARLQLLENELVGISQGTLSISQYFTKVKNICREISQLDPEEKVSEARMKRIIIHGLRPEYNGFIAAMRGWPTQPTLVELENLLANQEALAKQMCSITLKENDEEEALFIRKKGPLRGRGEAKEWTRGGRRCPKKSSYSEGAQQESEDEDQQDLMERRRKRGECFNCGKKGHLARDCESLRKHSEGNVATTKDMVVSGYLSEEEWNANTGITIEDDEAYFVEDLTASDTSSSNEEDEVEEEEEEWDMEEGFSIEVRDPNISNDLVFENARDEDWEALPNDEEDIEYKEIEPLYQEDKEVQENVEVIDGPLAAQEDTQVHCVVKKTQEASNKNWRMRKNQVKGALQDILHLHDVLARVYLAKLCHSISRARVLDQRPDIKSQYSSLLYQLLLDPSDRVCFEAIHCVLGKVDNSESTEDRAGGWIRLTREILKLPEAPSVASKGVLSKSSEKSSKARRPQPLIKLVMRRLESSFRSFSRPVLHAAARVVQEMGKSRAAAYALGAYDEGATLQAYSDNAESLDSDLENPMAEGTRKPNPLSNGHGGMDTIAGLLASLMEVVRTTATPDMAVTLLEIARIFATKVPGKIDADVLQLLWKTCLVGAGPDGKHTALEAVTIVLDLPPPQPGSMSGLTSVDMVSASDPKSAMALQRLVQAAVWFLGENANYAASEYAWESATPPGTALMMLDADKMVAAASSRNPTLASALTRLQRCAFSGSWEIRIAAVQALTTIAIRSGEPYRLQIYEFLHALALGGVQSNFSELQLSNGENQGASGTGLGSLISPMLKVLDEMYRAQDDLARDIRQHDNSKQEWSDEELKKLYETHERLLDFVSLFCFVPRAKYLPLGPTSAKLIEIYRNRHNISASGGLSDPAVATGISDLMYESKEAQKETGTMQSGIDPDLAMAWAAGLEDDVWANNAPAVDKVKNFLAGAGTDAPDVDDEEYMNSRPSVGYDDMWAKTILETYDAEEDDGRYSGGSSPDSTGSVETSISSHFGGMNYPSLFSSKPSSYGASQQTIREEPPSYSTSVQKRESFENPLSGRGGRSFGSNEDEDKSSGNPQSGKALYDFTAGGDDELSLTTGEEVEIQYEVDGWYYVKKKRPGRDGKMAGLVPVLYVSS
ncbi:hypothetical protein PR202_gb19339 [Eleusine coracana subsp. coracana]|uniref:Uncharacterized protein n=1 Tax=Eleusine coracana subsp. coracana TaxID=191504 RepID=A0AAV5F5R1_ELECO|nr:hypothetical protein PR202_gb19339 [Eleusine coracana subsp. coracana]